MINKIVFPNRLKVKTVITIGNFDGVHKGHQKVLRKLCEVARAENFVSTVVTFDPDPQAYFNPDFEGLLNSLDEKSLIFGEIGIDCLYVLPFPLIKNFTPQEFFTKVILPKISPAAFVTGEDFKFGKERIGDVNLLEKLCNTHNIRLHMVNKLEENHKKISSTMIRMLLKEKGDVEKATKFLGRYYSLAGRVVKGKGIGKILGFPTLNMIPSSPEKLVPKEGVYVTIINKEYKSTTYIGTSPTFGSFPKTIESYIFGGIKRIGKELKIEFVRRIRDEKKFARVDDLKAAIKKDIEITNSIFVECKTINP